MERKNIKEREIILEKVRLEVLEYNRKGNGEYNREHYNQ